MNVFVISKGQHLGGYVGQRTIRCNKLVSEAMGAGQGHGRSTKVDAFFEGCVFGGGVVF